ncbi:ribonuclease H-like domain-containing protein [Tanacetum coccineum]
MKKEEYDIWAMEMEHYLEYIDNDVWKGFEQESKVVPQNHASAQNVAFVSHSKSSTNKLSCHAGALQTCTPSNLLQTLFNEDKFPLVGFADEVLFIHKFYKKTGRRVQIDGNKPVGFDKKKLECFKCHNTSHFARECPSKGTNDGKKRDSFYKIKELVRKSRIRTVVDYG